MRTINILSQMVTQNHPIPNRTRPPKCATMEPNERPFDIPAEATLIATIARKIHLRLSFIEEEFRYDSNDQTVEKYPIHHNDVYSCLDNITPKPPSRQRRCCPQLIVGIQRCDRFCVQL